MKSLISIIVPAWREKDNPLILSRHFKNTDDVELIFALAEGDGETVVPQGPRVTAVFAPKGRASQMNAGARAATGEILVFLHADTMIEPESFGSVRKALSVSGVAGGAYRLKIDSPRFSLKLIAAIANLRSRLFAMPYGDQAIFVKRRVFEKAGGFDNIPIMEDVRLIEAVRDVGEVVIIEDFAVTSSRRWDKEGVFYATARNIALMSLHKLGASPQRLAGWYRS